MQQLALAIEANHFAAGAEAGIDGEDVLLAERRGQQQFAEVFSEDADGFRGRPCFLDSMRSLHFDGRAKQTLIAVLNRQPHLFASRFSGCLDEEWFEQDTARPPRAA